MVGRLWPRLAHPDGSRAIILNYHEVGYSSYGLLPERFAAQMQFLSSHSKVLGLAELLRGERSDGPLLCAITFDDGYAGVHDYAWPILERYGFPATVYLTTDAIQDAENAPSDLYPGLDPGQRMLSWQQIDRLAEGGFTFGSHLCQHLDLSRLSPEQGWRQLTYSKDVIQNQVGSPCIHLAYPWGRFSLRNIEWVRKAGYQRAVTVLHRGLPRRFDPYRVPRLSIDRDYTAEDFEAVVRGDWDYLGFLQALRRPISRL
jgi:peptidoglycan/xylan/chitin deacetylase (PgdA/CDA1 family)